MLGGTLVTSSATELNKLDGYTGSASDLQKIADYTGTASELNVLDLNANEIVGIFKIATSVPTQASDFTGNTKNNNGVLMVLSVLDGSTLRTPHNIYVLDGSNVRRVRQIRALDGSNIRHPFTKSDFFDFSGTFNTLNPATSEVYQYTIGNATNSGTQTVYTGYQHIQHWHKVCN